MSLLTNPIYYILKQLDLLEYWGELSKYSFDEFVNLSTNQIKDHIFDCGLNFITESDKNRIKQALIDQINNNNNQELNNDIMEEYEMTQVTESNQQLHSPSHNNFPYISSHDIKSQPTDDLSCTKTKVTYFNSPHKDKQNNNHDDIKCIHHFSYKAYGPNSFVSSYTKRYCIESTGEEIHTIPEENNNNSNIIPELPLPPPPPPIPASSRIYPLQNTHENSSSSTVNISNYNRSSYNPYPTNITSRHYSHNRMSSEPSRHHLLDYPNPIYAKTTTSSLVPFISPPLNTSSYQKRISSSQNDCINYNNNYPPVNIKQYGYNVDNTNKNIYHPFEGSKAMENSPLHKYNLLDPPIFKHHSIRIPSTIPFLIRLDLLDEDRMNMIKNSSIIYGKSDNRRKSSSLSINEMIMNEVAFQLCLRDPLYLISRQKLIMVSREIIRECGHRIQDDINIIPFDESNNCNQTKSHTDIVAKPIINQPLSSINSSASNNVHNNALVTDSIKNLTLSSHVKTINEVRDAPIMPVNSNNQSDPFFIQDESSSVQCRNLMAKYCYDDYDTIHYYKVHRKWPPNADSSRKAYLRRKSKKFKIIDNHLYSISSSSERLRLWLRDADAVMEHAARFHYKENGDHFTRNETISRMLRYCYSNDIPQGVTKFIKNCNVCTEKEYSSNVTTTTNNSTDDTRSQSALTNHQLLVSPQHTNHQNDSFHNLSKNDEITTNKFTLQNSEQDRHSSNDTANEEHHMYGSSENSVEIGCSSSYTSHQTICSSTSKPYTCKPKNILHSPKFNHSTNIANFDVSSSADIDSNDNSNIKTKKSTRKSTVSSQSNS